MKKRIRWRAAIPIRGAACLLALVWVATTTADEPPSQPAEVSHAADIESEEHSDAADADHDQPSTHGGGHDPYDLSTANAGAQQNDVAEFRSDLAIATVLVFLILLAVLWKFAWGPICEALDRRERCIADQLSEARRNNEEAHRLLAEHRERLDTAADEVRDLMDQARKDGDTLKQRMISEAEHTAATQKDRALREIDAAKNGALEELARTSVDQAVGLAGRIVGKQLRKEDHAKLIEDTLERMPTHG